MGEPYSTANGTSLELALDYPVCSEGKYGWVGESSHHSCESPSWDGCSYDNCAQKIQEGTAMSHCYTQSQIDQRRAGNGWYPRGCDYGSAANTCAYDDAGQCVYSDLSAAVSV